MTTRDLIGILQQDPTALACQKLESVDVAIVDSGIDATHERLQGRVCSAVACHSFSTDFPPQMLPAATPGNNDPSGHGTAVCGIVTAIAPNARIHDVRILDNNGGCSGEMLLSGLDYGISKGFRIINMSLSCNKRFAPKLSELCEKAYRSGTIIVAAKRNVPLSDDLGFPAEHSSCISVDNAIGSGLPYMANYTNDRTIEFEAYGNALLVPKAGGGYTRFTGTSFATPSVTGIISLFLGINPNLTLFELKTVLKHLRDTRPWAWAINPLENHRANIDQAQNGPGFEQLRHFICPKCKTRLTIPSVFRFSTCPVCEHIAEHDVR